MKTFITLLSVVILAFSSPIWLNYAWQELENSYWSKYAFKVTQDDIHWYTNAYNEKDGCVQFVNNYNKHTKWCEKYQIEENYWKHGDPTLQTALFGY